MSNPVIGITPSRLKDSKNGSRISIPEAYIQAITAAGGAPFIIPLGLPEDTLTALLARLDGVLFSGGGDMHPNRYHSSTHPALSFVDPDRDRVEVFVLHQITKQQVPFLGVCRGLQVINVALGGTLYEDILDQHPGGYDHRHRDGNPRSFLAHTISVTSDSRLRQILIDEIIQVNSLHHQGIRVLAPGLKASAAAPDGIIEAVELPDYPFGLAVQWHPEQMQSHQTMRDLFAAFVNACGQA